MMIEPDSTRVDLVYDELLRQLISMESTNVKVAWSNANTVAIESVIDIRGLSIVSGWPLRISQASLMMIFISRLFLKV